MRVLRSVFVGFIVLLLFLPQTVLAESSPWSQTDWSGGSGQTSFSSSNKYSSGSNVVTSSANQITLAKNTTNGTGNDGTITVSADKNINTDTMISGRSCSDGGDAVNYSVTASVASGAGSITLSSTPASGCLAAGDEILIINLQGTSGDNGNVGKYETATIQSISSATLTLSGTLTNAYDGTTQKIMVQRVPNYTNVTINGSTTLTASAWNGTKGGVLFFRASGTVTVTGTISATGKGYAGAAQISSNNTNGLQGDGTAGSGGTSNTANGNGGGGGVGRQDSGGGGGGGYASAGTNGVNSTFAGGTGGNAVGTSSLSTLFLGGGGGSGGADEDGAHSGAGGTGGGVVVVNAGTLTVSGAIVANGNTGSDGLNNAGCGMGGGGGGAGGSVLLTASTLSVGSTIVTATKGNGGSKGGACGGNGGAGSDGRIALYSANSISGTTNPTYGTATSAYATSGTLTSSIFDIGYSSVNWGTLTYSATTPSNTSVTVKVRTGSQSNLSDATAFSSCSAVSSGASVASNSCVSTTGEFVQYQITLSTSDTSATPTFTSFSLEFSSTAPGSGPPSTGTSNAPCVGTSIPGAPNLYQIISSEDSATLYFVPVSGVTGYTVQYGTTSSASQYAVSFDHSDTGGAVSYAIHSLQPETLYYFKVYGFKACSTTATSNTLSNIPSHVVRSAPPEVLVTPTAVPLTVSKHTLVTPTPSSAPIPKSAGVSLDVKVVDTNNAPLPGVNVTLHSVEQKSVTDAQGIAHFSHVETGEHHVDLAYNGFSGTQKLTVDGKKQNQELTMQVNLTQTGYSKNQVGSLAAVFAAVIGILLFLLFKKEKTAKEKK